MNTRHRALIVEDHSPSAEDLAEILGSIDCDTTIVDNKQDALSRIRAGGFCFVLLDLDIKRDPASIKGHPEHGASFLRELRALFPHQAAAGARMPVLVVSAHANEVDFAVSIMKDGADDVIRKPFEDRNISERVRQALERSGRAMHHHCAPPSEVGGGLVLTIVGDRVKRRTRVTLGAKATLLPNRLLLVLLHLVLGKLEGSQVHKIDLGGTDTKGFKGIAELRDALRAALPEGVDDIIDNDHHGNYCLKAEIQIGECNVLKLMGLGDPPISELAKKIASHRPTKV